MGDIVHHSSSWFLLIIGWKITFFKNFKKQIIIILGELLTSKKKTVIIFRKLLKFNYVKFDEWWTWRVGDNTSLVKSFFVNYRVKREEKKICSVYSLMNYACYQCVLLFLFQIGYFNLTSGGLDEWWTWRVGENTSLVKSFFQFLGRKNSIARKKKAILE